MYTNGGAIEFEERGMFSMIPVDMYYNLESIATVLLIKDVLDVENTYIIFDSRKRRSMFVYFGDKEFEFRKYSNGLYYYDYSDTHK